MRTICVTKTFVKLFSFKRKLPEINKNPSSELIELIKTTKLDYASFNLVKKSEITKKLISEKYFDEVIFQENLKSLKSKGTSCLI